MALTGEELCVSIICESRQMILSSTLRHSLFSPRKFGGDIFFFFFAAWSETFLPLAAPSGVACAWRHMGRHLLYQLLLSRFSSIPHGAIRVHTFSISFYCLDFRRLRLAPYGAHLLYQFLLYRFPSTPLPPTAPPYGYTPSLRNKGAIRLFITGKGK